MRAVGRNEMQIDPAPRSSKPFLHQSGVVIARVVKKDMDERQQRIERLDRFQQPDRRDGVDGYDLDHPGLSGREVDRAVNIDSIAIFSCFGAQQPAGRAAWVGCTASANSTASSSPKEFSNFS